MHADFASQAEGPSAVEVLCVSFFRILLQLWNLFMVQFFFLFRDHISKRKKSRHAVIISFLSPHYPAYHLLWFFFYHIAMKVKPFLPQVLVREAARPTVLNEQRQVSKAHLLQDEKDGKNLEVHNP